MENAMDMTKTTSFNTPRLTLRLMTNEEWIKFIDHVFEADECLLQFGYETSDDLREMLVEPYTEAVIYYTIILPETGVMVGYVGITPENDNLEFYIFAEHRRKGYVFEAVSALINLYLKGEITGKTQEKIYAEVSCDNEACKELLKKLGFVRIAVGFNMRNKFGVECFDYAA